jgi:hypothetical protein
VLSFYAPFSFLAGKRVVQAFDKSSPISTVFGFIKGVHSDEVTGPFDVIIFCDLIYFSCSISEIHFFLVQTKRFKQLVYFRLP